MDLIGDHHCGLARKRMEWIGDLNLTSQAPGIMTSRWIVAGSAPRPCTVSSSRRYAAHGIAPFMPPTELCRTVSEDASVVALPPSVTRTAATFHSA